ncbi:hypothetical protein [Streptomyces sp. NBC_00091]|uniref:hypothetical protein n=1 Tax=Streptomyces sp. NBC_00091 TaxID=2975648 RepID=UPI00225A5010|nr:hypothetical protein [Streptomyces sp. NBC_00091]MCX5377896.1 hypothetical protein [Streptomyces sp. NBC_00091]
MGIKDQFQDKANEIKDRAEKAKQGAKDEMAERTAKAKQKKDSRPTSLDDIKDELDDRT